MTFALNLLAMSSSGVEWSRPLMMAWLVIALALSVIEVWLTIRRRRSLTLAQVSRFVPPWDQMQSKKQTLKGFLSGEPFQGLPQFELCPQGSRELEPWAEVSERLRR